MSHTACYNGHSMWNGDGKPVVWAFRLNYFKDYQLRKPQNVVSESGSRLWQIYDCYDEDENYWEELDCWFCDECRSLAVFYFSREGDEYRADYIPAELSDEDYSINYEEWEEYIAFKDREFEEFSELYEGKRPYDALCSVDVPYKYRVSLDKSAIIAIKSDDGSIAFKYILAKHICLEPYYEHRIYPKNRRLRA